MPGYEIKLYGRINARWSTWFEGLEIAHSVDRAGESVTTLRGHLADQAALRGLLSRIWDLNLTLLSLHRLRDDL